MVIDGDDAFVILPLDEYEMMAGGFADDFDDDEEGECGDENCDCRHDKSFDDDFDFGEEIFANNENDKKPDEDEADKDLIKRVNEDIAKWREEQASHENIKTLKHENKEEEKPVEKVSEMKKDDVLTEEERYYLEPLE